MQEMTVVLECETRLFQYSTPLYIDRVIGVHQNIAYTVILQERLQGPRPNTSSTTSCARWSRSMALSGTPCSTMICWITVNSCCCAATVSCISRQFVEIDPLDQFFMHGRLDLLLYIVANRPDKPPRAFIGPVTRTGRT